MRRNNSVGTMETPESLYCSGALRISDQETSTVPAYTSCCSDSCPEFSSPIFTGREVLSLTPTQQLSSPRTFSCYTLEFPDVTAECDVLTFYILELRGSPEVPSSHCNFLTTGPFQPTMAVTRSNFFTFFVSYTGVSINE